MSTDASEWDDRRQATPLRLVIGITGHRNPRLDRIDRMRSDFVQALEHLRARAPSTPLIVLSALAAGCDQLAAGWALDWGDRDPLPDGSPRVRLVVPRPLAREDYLEDFPPGSPERAAFESLEARAWLAFDLPDGEPRDGAPLDRDARGLVVDAEGRQHRAEHYRRLGRFVAQQSHVMVAFWDGTPPKMVGGTAEVVEFCRHGGTLNQRGGGAFATAPFRERCPELSTGDPTPVWVVETPREGGPPQGEAPSTVSGRRSSNAAETVTEIGRIALEIERLNREIRKVQSMNPREPRPCPFRRSHLVSVGRFEEACGTFESLDAVARSAKRAFLGRMKWFAWLTAVAITLFQLFSSFSSERFGKIGLLGYVLLLIAAWWCHRDVRRRRLEWLFVHARAQAEILRVQLAMAMVGYREEVSDWGLAHRESELRAVRVLLRGTALGLLSLPRVDDHGRGIDDARKLWLEDQCAYWRSQRLPGTERVRGEAWLGVEPRLRLVVFVIAVLLCVASSGVAGSWVLQRVGVADADVYAWGCLLMGSLLALLAGLGLWRAVSLDGEDLRQFARMERVFGRAIDRLDAPREADGRLEGLRRVLRAAGREQFDDTCTWYVRHRDSIPDVTSG